MKKSIHEIVLNKNFKVERGKLDNVTFQITNDKRAYYLAAESSHSAQEWITGTRNIFIFQRKVNVVCIGALQ